MVHIIYTGMSLPRRSAAWDIRLYISCMHCKTRLTLHHLAAYTVTPDLQESGEHSSARDEIKPQCLPFFCEPCFLPLFLLSPFDWPF